MNSNIRRLNDLIRQELGGAEVFEWKHSEDLKHHARKIDPDTGNKVYTYRCQCGYDVRRHTKSCRRKGSIIVAEPVYIECLLRPDKRDQWCLAKLHAAVSEAEWLREFGTMLLWPKHGTWLPCDPVWLEPGEQPTQALTWEVIKAVRANRSHTFADRMAEAEAIVDKRDRDNRERLLEEIKEDTHMPFGALPGRKDTVSHGGTRDLFQPQGEVNVSSSAS